MKRILTLTFFVTVLSSAVMAQCTINTGNITNGFTPDSLPCITQGLVYGQAVQVKVPTSQAAGPFSVTIDSVLLLSVTGLPAGITVSGVPANGIIHGGGNGCLWYSGTTSAATGTYQLTFNVRVWTDFMGTSVGPMDTTLTDFGYTFSLNVCAGASAAPVVGFGGTPLSGCSAFAVQFTDSTSGSPTSWHWTFSGPAQQTSTLQNPNITFSTPGNYNVKLVATNASGSDSTVKVGYVTVYPNPSLTVSSTPASSGTALDGTASVTAFGGTSPYTYAWTGGGTTATDSNLLHGEYGVVVTDFHGCHSVDSVAVSFTSGIPELDGKQVRIYPDPAYDVLNIDWNVNAAAEITIADLNGQIVKHFVANANQLNTFNIHDLPSGTYVISITDKESNRHQNARFTKF